MEPTTYNEEANFQTEKKSQQTVTLTITYNSSLYAEPSKWNFSDLLDLPYDSVTLDSYSEITKLDDV